MISLRHVSKSFDRGKTYAVRDVSFDVFDGETLVLVGSSGSGKTTILKMINRLIDHTSGEITVHGRNVREVPSVRLRRQIGYVFQGIGLFPHMTVLQNVEIVPRLLNWPPAKRRARSIELLHMVGLGREELWERLPDELSGGQQQRVGVARALAADPAYLLMDEPFGAVDPLTRDGLQQELLDLKTRLSKTIVFVTHDILEALRLGDRIAVLHRGRLEQVGTRADLFRNPATPTVRDFVMRPAQQLAEFSEVF